jgi:hypothetical protein
MDEACGASLDEVSRKQELISQPPEWPAVGRRVMGWMAWPPSSFGQNTHEEKPNIPHACPELPIPHCRETSSSQTWHFTQPTRYQAKTVQRGEAGATGGPADPSTCPGLATQNFPNRKESAYFQTRPPWENQTVLVLLGASPCLTVITSFYEVQQPSSRPAYPHSK